MSVIIPNMKMPMSCLACPLAREMFGCLVCVGYFKDNLTGRRVYKSDLKESDKDFNRPDWCPLVQLPEEHGDLVDRDALRAENGLNAKCEHCPTNTYKCQNDMIHTKMDFCEMLDDATVIVPAEGGTDNGN